MIDASTALSIPFLAMLSLTPCTHLSMSIQARGDRTSILMEGDEGAAVPVALF